MALTLLPAARTASAVAPARTPFQGRAAWPLAYRRPAAKQQSQRGHLGLAAAVFAGCAALRAQRGQVSRQASKELDTDAVTKYFGAVVVQMVAITLFFKALDLGIAAAAIQPPDWAIFVLFFGMALRSRIFSPLDASRPDANKAASGETTGGFNDRVMPSWTPPGIFFPIMWILIQAPLRAYASLLIFQQVGHLCDPTLLALMLHLSIGDTWNTVNNVEKRLGAAVPGVLCVLASAMFAAYSYYQVLPLAGQALIPLCLWLTVASALVTDTWRINNSQGDEPLYPYKGITRTRYWFMTD